jgi:hypothetical protein
MVEITIAKTGRFKNRENMVASLPVASCFLGTGITSLFRRNEKAIAAPSNLSRYARLPLQLPKLEAPVGPGGAPGPDLEIRRDPDSGSGRPHDNQAGLSAIVTKCIGRRTPAEWKDEGSSKS